jgi:hypothetical protein
VVKSKRIKDSTATKHLETFLSSNKTGEPLCVRACVRAFVCVCVHC